MNTSFLALATPLGSTITHFSLIGSSSPDNEALHKVSSIYDRPSDRRREHKPFHTPL
jgi:hypothetical protein